jgi:hypothetical protein
MYEMLLIPQFAVFCRSKMPPKGFFGDQATKKKGLGMF